MLFHFPCIWKGNKWKVEQEYDLTACEDRKSMNLISYCATRRVYFTFFFFHYFGYVLPADLYTAA